MSDMVENGSHRGASALPAEDTHSDFLELCALATSGLLSASEEKRLHEHLAQCPSCREAMAQYQAITDKVVPALASEHAGEWSANLSDPADAWSLEDAEAALFQRLDDDQVGKSSVVPFPAPTQTNEGEDLWRYMWWQYAAGILLLAALGWTVYRFGLRHGTELARNVSPVLTEVQTPSASHPENQTATTSSDKKDSEIASLRVQLAQQANEIYQLKSRQTHLESDLNARLSDSEQSARERADLAQQLTTAQARLQDTQSKLAASTNESTANTVQIAALQARITELNTALHQRDEAVAHERQLLDRDRDIRDLMTARDLHIADVYDVAEDGKTEKAFGRVFYARGKSLTFYAYDLDQSPGLTPVSTFQVWGRRGPDQMHAVNLGILFQDDAAKKRWVLKSHDAKTLEDIDAVFVTVEPGGGSQHPSTKPLLFGYLRNEPNHP